MKGRWAEKDKANSKGNYPFKGQKDSANVAEDGSTKAVIETLCQQLVNVAKD